MTFGSRFFGYEVLLVTTLMILRAGASAQYIGGRPLGKLEAPSRDVFDHLAAIYRIDIGRAKSVAVLQSVASMWNVKFNWTQKKKCTTTSRIPSESGALRIAPHSDFSCVHIA